MAKDGGSADLIGEQKIQETVDQFIEHILEQPNCDQLLDEGYEYIPELVLDKIKEIKKYTPVIEAADDRYKKRLEIEGADVLKKQLELEKRSVVHCTRESFDKRKAEATPKELEHLERWEKVWMPMVHSFFEGMFDNFAARFKQKYIVKYVPIDDAKRAELKAKGIEEVGTEMPMYDEKMQPVLEDKPKLILELENLGTAKYYELYFSEILERLLKDNVKEYKKKITRK